MGQLVFQATLGGQVNLVGPNTASTFNLNVPAVSSTLATLTGTETFTNKTLTSPTLTAPVLGTPASGTLTNCTSLPVGGITATGTPSSTTFLRGDSSWATIATNAISNGTSNVTVNSSGGSITAATNGTTAITVDTSQNTTFAKSIILSGSTSGTTTLASTAVAGTSTATFPAATGTVMVSGNMPLFSYYSTSAQSLSANTATKILFATSLYDTTGGMFSSSRFTPTIAGYYKITGRVGPASSACGNTIYMYKNGSEFFRGEDTTASNYGVYVTGLVYCNGSTDYIEIYCAFTTAQNNDARSNTTYFQGYLARTP